MANTAKLVAENKDGKHSAKSPKAIAPPRGRPCKDAGKRKKSFYENGPAATKRRCYVCSLCGRTGHVKTDCILRQTFKSTKQTTNSDGAPNEATSQTPQLLALSGLD